MPLALLESSVGLMSQISRANEPSEHSSTDVDKH